MCARRDGPAVDGSIAPWNFQMCDMPAFGAAATSNAGGRTKFSAIVVRNALEFLKCIRGQTAERKRIDNATAQSCARIGTDVLKNFHEASLAKMSMSQSTSIACTLKKQSRTGR